MTTEAELLSLDDLVKEQKKCSLKISKILSNFKKDSAKRKTKEYAESRLSDLEELWAEFEDRHQDILGLKDEYPEHIYFGGNFYLEVESLYNKIKNSLEQVWDNPFQISRKEKAEQEAKQKKHKAISTTLQRAISKIEGEMHGQTSLVYFTEKISLLNEYWSRFVISHEEILMVNELPSDEYLTIFDNLEDTYQATIIKLQEKYEILKSNKVAPSTRAEENIINANAKIKLPRISIPVFGGDYLKWQSFKDLFTEIIHKDEKIAPAEKLFYLKTNLTGEPAELIRHLQTTNENYKTAWEILNKRFDNQRLLVAAQLQSLLNQPNLKQESADGLKKLHDTTTECLLAINNMGIETKDWDPLLVYILVQKLDRETHRLYEQSLTKPREVQPLKTFLDFLENRFQSLEALTTTKINTITKADLKQRAIVHHGQITRACTFCKAEHTIYSCPDFAKLPVQRRTETIRKAKLCENCLVRGHFARECKSWKVCKLCGKKHHTLLHQATSVKPKPSLTTDTSNKPIEKTEASSSTEIRTHTANSSQSVRVLLPTAIVTVVGNHGIELKLRALIDQGSQASFITEAASQQLRLKKKKTYAEVSGIGMTKTDRIQTCAELTIKPRFQSDFVLTTTAFVLKQLTKLLPSDKVEITGNWSNNNDLLLADPDYAVPGRVDLILGAESYGRIILNDLLRIKPNGPVAQKTELGWILSGEVGSRTEKTISCFVSEVDIHNDLRKFWEVEELESERVTTSEDAACENHFRTTHKRLPDGRYVVRIPFKEDPERVEELHGSRELALARLFQMERKFRVDTVFETLYKNFISEYIRLGHMVPATDNVGKTHYLPHHAVLKADSSTTALRVVFNASAKRTSTKSLNDIMMTGPQLQQNLTHLLIRWRMHRIAFTADIEKMFRQIKVDVRDQDYQRILWRDSPNKPIQEYKLTTVTYGTAAAPFLAIRTLHQLAQDDGDTYPIAAKILVHDTYVDDVVSGADTINEAKEASDQLIKLLRGGGFTLRKWSSNSKTLLNTIPKELHESNNERDLDQDKALKTLGLLWNPRTDTFRVRVNNNLNSNENTKRQLLSEAAKIFDPIGLLAPVTIKIKLLLQEIWKQGTNWDVALPETILNEWIQIKTELPTLEKLEIPRWINYSSNHSEVQLHGFADASEAAYSAVVYLRTIFDGKVNVSLIASKTKVAPLKGTLTLPRLELCGATLLANLLKETKRSLGIPNLEYYAWTDSTIVLSWIREDAHRWKTFVGNRVAQIQAVIDSKRWFHVKSSENPADIASRGVLPSALKAQTLWWEGPQWLKSKQISCINEKPTSEQTVNTINLERRKVEVHVATQETKGVYEELLDRVSSLGKL